MAVTTPTGMTSMTSSPVLRVLYKGLEKEDHSLCLVLDSAAELGFWRGSSTVSAATGCIIHASIFGAAESYRTEIKGKLGQFLHCFYGWELWGTLGCLCHLAKMRMRKVLR